jgi:hypothetical protein
MDKKCKGKKALGIICGLGLATLITAKAEEPETLPTAKAVVEAEKQPIFVNIQNGSLCGTTINTQCKVPTGQRLIIEYVSGYVFKPPSSNQTTGVSMEVTDPSLGLNGNSFHIFPAIKVNTTPNTDVFAFTAPLRMMLHPNATFYFSDEATIAVSGYLVNFTGP